MRFWCRLKPPVKLLHLKRWRKSLLPYIKTVTCDRIRLVELFVAFVVSVGVFKRIFWRHRTERTKFDVSLIEEKHLTRRKSHMTCRFCHPIVIQTGREVDFWRSLDSCSSAWVTSKYPLDAFSGHKSGNIRYMFTFLYRRNNSKEIGKKSVMLLFFPLFVSSDVYMYICMRLFIYVYINDTHTCAYVSDSGRTGGWGLGRTSKRGGDTSKTDTQCKNEHVAEVKQVDACETELCDVAEFHRWHTGMRDRGRAEERWRGSKRKPCVLAKHAKGGRGQRGRGSSEATAL